MAIKLVVEYVNLQASVTSQDVVLSVQTADESAPKLSTTFADLDLQVSNQVIAPISGVLLDFVNLNLALNYLNPHVEIFVDSDTKNLYFYPGNPNAVTINITEETAFAVGKALTDSFGMADLPEKEIGKAASDSVAMTESLFKEVLFVRSFADSFSMAESAALLLARPVSDSLSVSESLTTSFNKQPSDQFGMADSDIKLSELGKTDTVTMTENLSRVAQFIRTFTDGVAMDDTASVDDELQTDIALVKNNIISFLDSQVFSTSSSKSDTLAISELLSYSFNTTSTDSVTINESIAISLLTGSSSVLNTSAFNTSALN